MIIDGKSRGNGAQLGLYLVTPGENERVQVVEIRGLAAHDVPGAVLEMDALAAGAQTEKPLYHASINTRSGERMTDEQRMRAIDVLEEKLGLTGQPRVVVIHEKKGREHCHVVWSRIEAEQMRAIPDSHNYRKHEEAGRQLEREFGHERVQGAHIEREGQERPARRPSHAELQQAKRTGFSPSEVKKKVTALWRSSDTGKSFHEALLHEGYILARGDRRDFVVIDPGGGTHSLARCVEGAKTKDIRARMADLEPAVLPSVAAGKQMQHLRQERDVTENERLRIDPLQYDRDVVSQKGRRQDTPEWTDHAGMVEQQAAALKWVKEQERKAARAEHTDRKQETRDGEEALTQRRQALLREFGRNVENELDPSDLDRRQERTRR